MDARSLNLSTRDFPSASSLRAGRRSNRPLIMSVGWLPPNYPAPTVFEEMLLTQRTGASGKIAFRSFITPFALAGATTKVGVTRENF